MSEVVLDGVTYADEVKTKERVPRELTADQMAPPTPAGTTALCRLRAMLSWKMWPLWLARCSSSVML
jgi:hypothetical protein